jgi:hypothetical protein
MLPIIGGSSSELANKK